MTINGSAAGDEKQAERTTPMPGARLALVLLLAINLFNYIDRQVLAAVEPDIRKELLNAEDPQAKFKMGMLATAFLVTYMIMAIPFGWLADRMGRWHLVAIGVVLWSLASGATGFNWGLDSVHPFLNLGFTVLSQAFLVILLTRCFVGIGEAAYGPVAPTMISDLFPVKIRGRVMAWFYMAIPVGSALGYALGGQVASAMGWRWAFFLVVPPGLLLGVWCMLMREPVKGQADDGAVHRATAVGWNDYKDLFRIPSYVFDTLGMAAMTFALGGLGYWMPAFLEEHKAVGIYGIDPRTLFGGLTALAGLIATMAGGLAGDWLRGRFPGSYFLVSAFAMFLGFPLLLLVVWTPFPLAWVYIFLAVFCLFFNTGPTNTILANVTHPSVRASAFAINIFIIHALGDALSPPMIGWISGHSSLNVGFVTISVSVLVGGIFWLWGTRYLERDTRLAPTRLQQ